MSSSAITFYQCATCKLYIPAKKTCQIMIPQMQGQINENDYCSRYTDIIYQCETCGGGLLNGLIEVSDEKTHIYCENCLRLRSSQKPEEKKEEKE